MKMTDKQQPEALDPAADLDERERRIWWQEKYDALRQRAEAAEATITRICAAFQGDDPEPPTSDEMVADAPDYLHALKKLGEVMDMDDKRRAAEAENAKLRAVLGRLVEVVNQIPQYGTVKHWNDFINVLVAAREALGDTNRR